MQVASNYPIMTVELFIYHYTNLFYTISQLTNLPNVENFVKLA